MPLKQGGGPPLLRDPQEQGNKRQISFSKKKRERSISLKSLHKSRSGGKKLRREKSVCGVLNIHELALHSSESCGIQDAARARSMFKTSSKSHAFLLKMPLLQPSQQLGLCRGLLQEAADVAGLGVHQPGRWELRGFGKTLSLCDSLINRGDRINMGFDGIGKMVSCLFKQGKVQQQWSSALYVTLACVHTIVRLVSMSACAVSLSCQVVCLFGHACA